MHAMKGFWSQEPTKRITPRPVDSRDGNTRYTCEYGSGGDDGGGEEVCYQGLYHRNLPISTVDVNARCTNGQADGGY